MATSPQPRNLDELEEDFASAADGAKLSGHTVDVLLAQGKIEEARAELERLIQEGIDSGPGKPMTEDLLQQVLAKARSRAIRAR
jgi:ABC-type xylose transport system substrate-binding protein